ncbi:MAG: hypothetical protein D6785_08865 [Planctomycetota bacterium]|nr:MAG: hypothetical protein D6785_08865 [Planctomycetota bacterium]
MSNPKKPGRFTQQFDSQILNRLFEESGDESQQKEIEDKLKKIEEKLAKRMDFILERFPNAHGEERDGEVEIVFSQTDEHPEIARMIFSFHVNEETYAVKIDFTMNIGEKTKKDYIMLTLKKFEPNRIDRFIESKMLQFAREYVGLTKEDQ